LPCNQCENTSETTRLFTSHIKLQQSSLQLHCTVVDAKLPLEMFSKYETKNEDGNVVSKDVLDNDLVELDKE
jgi:hypothetical protein